MAKLQDKTELSYGVIIIGLALAAWGISRLLALDTLLAQWFAGILVLLATMTCIAGIVHYWRYGMHK